MLEAIGTLMVILAVVFVGTLLANLIWHPASLFTRKAKRVAELECQGITLLAERNEYFRQSDNKRVARIQVKAVGHVSILDVGLTCTAIDDNLNAYADCLLSTTDTFEGHIGTFNLNPSSPGRFVEVVMWTPGDDHCHLCYHAKYQAFLKSQDNPFVVSTRIEARKHTLTIQATGRNIAPTVMHFEIDFNAGRMLFRPSL